MDGITGSPYSSNYHLLYGELVDRIKRDVTFYIRTLDNKPLIGFPEELVIQKIRQSGQHHILTLPCYNAIGLDHYLKNSSRELEYNYNSSNIIENLIDYICTDVELSLAKDYA